MKHLRKQINTKIILFFYGYLNNIIVTYIRDREYISMTLVKLFFFSVNIIYLHILLK